jgi:glycosyltransferase involved in cell wall biosynthesis
MTVHDLLYARHPEWLPTRRARWYWATWIPFTARHASAVIAPSEATKQDLISLSGVPADRVIVVPHAVDPLFLRRPSQDTIRAYRERQALTEPYVLYVGAIDRRKDWQGLLKAFAKLLRAFPSFRLVIAGHVSGERSDLTEAIRVADLGRAVVLAGHVPDQDLPALYAGAALFVYPSFWEGFGLPPLEAMAMGVPVIVYKTASLPEVVGDAGILLDAPYAYTSLAESMERLIADETLRKPWRCTQDASGHERRTTGTTSQRPASRFDTRSSWSFRPSVQTSHADIGRALVRWRACRFGRQKFVPPTLRRKVFADWKQGDPRRWVRS